jgi:hypothetical protein
MIRIQLLLEEKSLPLEIKTTTTDIKFLKLCIQAIVVKRLDLSDDIKQMIGEGAFSLQENKDSNETNDIQYTLKILTPEEIERQEKARIAEEQEKEKQRAKETIQKRLSSLQDIMETQQLQESIQRKKPEVTEPQEKNAKEITQKIISNMQVLTPEEMKRQKEIQLKKQKAEEREEKHEEIVKESMSSKGKFWQGVSALINNSFSFGKRGNKPPVTQIKEGSNTNEKKRPTSLSGYSKK